MKRFISVLILGASTGLVACGGGSSSDSSSSGSLGVYNGSSSPASISSSAAAAKLTGNLLSSGSSLSQMSSYSNAGSALKLRATAASNTAQDQCGGSFSYTSSASGDFNITYTNYHIDCTASPNDYMSGTLSVTTSTDAATSITTNVLIFDNMNDYVNGTLVSSFSGNMSAWTNTNLSTSGYTMSFEWWDNTGTTLDQGKVENFAASFDVSGNLTHIAGKFYDATNGYFSLDTTTDFDWTGCTNGYPWSGVLVMTDAAGDRTVDFGTGSCATANVTEANGTVTSDVSL